MMRVILKVFAATNSAMRYGRGFMFALFAKCKMKGVKVSMTMSFEVKAVRIDTVMYNTKNKLFCEDFAFVTPKDAKY